MQIQFIFYIALLIHNRFTPPWPGIDTEKRGNRRYNRSGSPPLNIIYGYIVPLYSLLQHRLLAASVLFLD